MKWKQISVNVAGRMVQAYLHPPNTVKNPKYWYYSCDEIGASRRSLKVTTLVDARVAVTSLITDSLTSVRNAGLSWSEFRAIQVTHFGMRANEKKSGRTLEAGNCSLRMFLALVNPESPGDVTPDMVGRFQILCREKGYSPATVHKALTHLSSGFNRCCASSGRRCIRGVVDDSKLLGSNPFMHVRWIEPRVSVKRQFGVDDIKNLMSWPKIGKIPSSRLFIQVSLWSAGRIEEMTEIKPEWLDGCYLTIPDSVAKWGKGRCVRFPESIAAQLAKGWRSFPEELRQHHRSVGKSNLAVQVMDFEPRRFQYRMQRIIRDWAYRNNVRGLSHHSLRRTALQWSREQQIRKSEAGYAEASNVNLSVGNTHYTVEPRRLLADIVYANISHELYRNGLAEMFGLDQNQSKVDSVIDLLRSGDLEAAKRIMDKL